MGGDPAPIWKDKFVDREWLKATVKAAFVRCAKGRIDEEIGALVNDLERYVAGEVLLNSKEVIQGIRKELDDAAEFMTKIAEGIGEGQIKRRARQLGSEGGEAGK